LKLLEIKRIRLSVSREDGIGVVISEMDGHVETTGGGRKQDRGLNDST
jgi:hypothetical protein